MIKKSLIKLTAMTFALNLAVAGNSYSMSFDCSGPLKGVCSDSSDFGGGSSPIAIGFSMASADSDPVSAAAAVERGLASTVNNATGNAQQQRNDISRQNAMKANPVRSGGLFQLMALGFRISSKESPMVYAQNDNIKSRYDAQTFSIGDKKINSYFSYSTTSGEQDLNDNLLNGFDIDSNSIVVGLNTEIQKGLLVGVNFTATQSEIDFELGNESDLDRYAIEFTATKKLNDKFFVNGGFEYAMNENSSTRKTVIDNNGTIVTNGGTVTADFDSTAYSFNIGGGMIHQYQDFAFIPALNLNYTSLSTDGYDEEGAGNLVVKNVEMDDLEILEASVGVTAVHKGYKFGNNVISPKASVNYGRELINDGGESSFSFSGHVTGDDRIVITADEDKRSRLNLGLGVEAYNTNGFNLKFDYVNTKIEDFSAHTFRLMTGYQF